MRRCAREPSILFGALDSLRCFCLEPPTALDVDAARDLLATGFVLGFVLALAFDADLTFALAEGLREDDPPRFGALSGSVMRHDLQTRPCVLPS